MTTKPVQMRLTPETLALLEAEAGRRRRAGGKATRTSLVAEAVASAYGGGPAPAVLAPAPVRAVASPGEQADRTVSAPDLVGKAAKVKAARPKSRAQVQAAARKAQDDRSARLQKALRGF